MTTTQKWLLGITAALGLYWIVKKKKLADNLEFELVSVDNFNFGLGGVSFTANLRFHNPRTASVKIKHPKLQVYFSVNGEEKFIGATAPNNSLIPIPANSAVDVSLDFSATSMQTLTLIPSIMQAMQGNQNVEIVLKIYTGIEGTDLPVIIEKFPITGEGAPQP